MRKRKFRVVILSGILVAAGLWAEDTSEIRLGRIVVTAQRYETEEMTTSAFTTVITAEELENTGARNLLQGLRSVSGLDHVSLGPMGASHGGMNSYLPIRGLRNGELILLNGVPLNSPSSGSYDLSCIPVSVIERVEVVKGPCSVLYGSSALTGVINIITKSGRSDDLQGSLHLEGGTESYTKDSIALGNNTMFGALSCLHLGAQEQISRNYTSQSSYSTKALDNYGVFLNVNLLDGLSFNYLGSREETGFVREPWEGVQVTSSNQRQARDQMIEKHFANLKYSNNGFTVNNYHYSDDLQYDYEDGSTGSETDAYRCGVNPQYQTRFGRDSTFHMLVGGDYQHEYADASRHGPHRRNNCSLYSTLTHALSENLSVAVGGRQQWIGQPGADDYSEFCPQLQANYLITPAFALYGNVARAFRAPDFIKLYYDSSWLVGNPDLKPESGWGYEIGTKCMTKSCAAKIAGFLMTYEDKVETDFSVGYPLTYYNANEFQTYGVEWDLSASFADGWTVGVGGYLADPVAEDADGEEEQAGAKLQLCPRVGLRADRFRAEAKALISHDRQRNLDDFVSTDVLIGYRVGKGEVTLTGSNVFDERNVTYGDMRESSATRYEYYDTGRIVSLGYRMDF